MGRCPITGGEQLQPQTIGKIARKHTGGGKIAYLFQSFMQQPPINAKGRANFVITFSQIAVFVQPASQFHRQSGNIAIADFLGNLAQNVRCQSAFFSRAVLQHGGDIAAFPFGKIDPHRFNFVGQAGPARAVNGHRARRFAITAFAKMRGIKG